MESLEQSFCRYQRIVTKYAKEMRVELLDIREEVLHLKPEKRPTWVAAVTVDGEGESSATTPGIVHHQ